MGSKAFSTSRKTICRPFPLNLFMESLMNKFRGKGLHIVFLDVEKAFDKAWREVIMWLMNERGCGKKEWIYLETLNSENKVRVNTVFGPTDEVSIDRVIK